MACLLQWIWIWEWWWIIIWWWIINKIWWWDRWVRYLEWWDLHFHNKIWWCNKIITTICLNKIGWKIKCRMLCRLMVNNKDQVCKTWIIWIWWNNILINKERIRIHWITRIDLKDSNKAKIQISLFRTWLNQIR